MSLLGIAHCCALHFLAAHLEPTSIADVGCSDVSETGAVEGRFHNVPRPKPAVLTILLPVNLLSHCDLLSRTACADIFWVLQGFWRFGGFLWWLAVCCPILLLGGTI